MSPYTIQGHHQRHSSKTTKKLEMSIASALRSNDGGKLLSRDLVRAKSKSFKHNPTIIGSTIVFSKQAQKRIRKELKRKQMLNQTIQRDMIQK